MSDDQKTSSAIIIDTNAFIGKGNDFCGFNSSSIPALFATINRLGLQSLSHPILHGEIIKHIYNGDFKTQPENAKKSLIRHKTVLELAGIQTADIFQKLSNLDLCSRTVEEYNKLYKDATILPFPDPEEVFEKYFNNEPPFSENNNKKAEFPDAFVINAINHFIEDNPDINLFVITNDNDWVTSLQDKSHIRILSDIDTALSVFNQTESAMKECVQTLRSDISLYVNSNAEMDIWFELEGYECVDDVEAEDIRLLDIQEEIVPLKISDDEFILQIKIDLEVDGSATVVDYDRSVWDREDNAYIIKEFSVVDFKEASGEVTAELYIRRDLGEKPVLEHMWLIAPYGVSLEPKEDKVYFTRIFGDDNYI